MNILTFAKLHFLFFDGRAPEFYGGAVHSALRCIRDASYLVFSVPAYWGSISGAAKNFFDVLAGPAYDNPSQCSLFSGKNWLYRRRR
ncbi:NAD(P)H-dependent oxidoreductase [Corynebacterium belfantii]|nr:NAD(P)H-dependent oxidoreductase [Corynebacterium belfantii]